MGDTITVAFRPAVSVETMSSSLHENERRIYLNPACDSLDQDDLHVDLLTRVCGMYGDEYVDRSV